MGTSQSSVGPNSGVPLVPPWADDIGGTMDADGARPGDPELSGAHPPPAEPGAPPAVETAPPRRFGDTRKRLGAFARSGEIRDLRRGLGSYVRRGYSGSATTARRFGSTVATAGALNSVLSNWAAGRASDPSQAVDTALFAGRTVREITDALIDAVRPVDGTQDAEANRASIADAVADLLTRHPTADLANLTDEQRMLAIELFVANDVFRRIELDVGASIRNQAGSATTALARLKQVRDYIVENVAAAFRVLRESGRAATAGSVGALVRLALKDTLDVFEGYSE